MNICLVSTNCWMTAFSCRAYCTLKRVVILPPGAWICTPNILALINGSSACHAQWTLGIKWVQIPIVTLPPIIWSHKWQWLFNPCTPSLWDSHIFLLSWIVRCAWIWIIVCRMKGSIKVSSTTSLLSDGVLLLFVPFITTWCCVTIIVHLWQ